MAQASKKQDDKEKSTETAPTDQPQVPKMRWEVPKMRWEVAKMKTSYANVCNVTGSREEFNILYGTNQSWQSDSGEMMVEMNNRILMSPFAAKRLLFLLNNAIQQYESQFGEIKLDIPAAQQTKE